MNKLRYFLFWVIPLIFLCMCGYNFINAAWVYINITDNLERLDGYAYLGAGIIQAVLLVLSSSIAIALSVYTYRKQHFSITDKLE